MDNPRVSDIRQLESDNTSIARDGRVARFLGEIVAACSLLPRGEFQLSGVGCRRRPNHRPCAGKIRLGRHSDTDDIHWTCPTCGDQGVITNWQHTRWDLQEELQGGRIVSLSLERARRSGGRSAVLPRLQAYELMVELVHAPFLLEERVARQVQLTGDSTLQDLHSCLHAAFDRQDEQPYEFMFGPPYDPETRRFSGPGTATDDGEGFWDTRLVRVDTLGLRSGDSFGYLYDFNDEWVHRITVLGVHEARASVVPRVVERLGASPPWPPEEREQPGWQLETSCPMSSLYGPYCAEEGPDPEDWLALDELERQLLVMESHAPELPPRHPPVASLLLHAQLHSLAETHLCERAGEAETDRIRCAASAKRHELVHELGAGLIRQEIELCEDRAARARGGPRPGHRSKTKDPP